jgi:hypothetical protein
MASLLASSFSWHLSTMEGRYGRLVSDHSMYERSHLLHQFVGMKRKNCGFTVNAKQRKLVYLDNMICPLYIHERPRKVKREILNPYFHFFSRTCVTRRHDRHVIEN